MSLASFRTQFAGIADACALAQAIVDTVREPMLVLDKDLRVIAASRSFYSTFNSDPMHTQGRHLYAVGDGAWNVPKLQVLLEKIIPENGTIEDYEIEHEFPACGTRTMCLNARQVFYEGDAAGTILLAMEDITERKATEREMNELLLEKDLLLDEMRHRVANSLQIVASIILMKARTVESEETRLHLRDAHARVLSVVAVQRQLHAASDGQSVEIAPYLSLLCESLAASMINPSRPILLRVAGGNGCTTPRQAESIGLIVTELVMNALKHAFPDDRTRGKINVDYETAGANWKLTVADDGAGRPGSAFSLGKSGLGTGIVKALSQQLGAQVETVSGTAGTTVSITHATFPAGSLAAAMIASREFGSNERVG